MNSLSVPEPQQPPIPPVFGDPVAIAKYILPDQLPDDVNEALEAAELELEELEIRLGEIEGEIEDLQSERLDVEDELAEQEKVVTDLKRRADDARYQTRVNA